LEDVELLRAAIFGPAAADRAGEEGDEADASPRDPAATGSSTDRLVHAISVRQLVLAGLISNRGFLLIPILLGVFFQFDLEERFDVDQVERYLPATVTWQQTALWTTAGVLLLLVLLRTFSIGWFLWRFYGHRVERHGDDLRVACGLFTRVSATVPRRRIQFISVQQTWLGRWAGLAVIRLETAGGAGKQGEEAKESVARRWFVPAIRSTDVPAVLAELRPGLEFDPRALPWHATSPRTARRLTRLAVLKAALIAALCGLVAWELALGVGVGMLVALVWHARRYARSLRYAGTDRWVVFRSGILTRKVSIAFFDKIQAVAISQTPFDRRWGMSTLRVDTAAAGPAQHRIEVKYLPSDVAADEAARVAWQASRYQLDPQGV
jgi:putative membrane protein